MAEMSTFRRVLRGIGRGVTAFREFFINAMFVLFLLVIVVLLLAGPDRVNIPDTVALVIAPKGSVVEQSSRTASVTDLLGASDLADEAVLRNIVTALKRARNDDRVQLVVLKLGDLVGISPAHLEAIGAALAATREAGKEMIAIGDYYTQSQYYLASFADAVYMHPMGQIGLSGLGIFQNYYRELLDKLKINVHVFRAGTYKAAMEPYMLTAMSDEARENNRELLNVLWADYLETVSSNRNIEPAVLERFIEEPDVVLEGAGGDLARAALEHGLIDELLSRDELRNRLIAKVGEDDGSYRAIGIGDYLRGTADDAVKSADQIGVVVASGMILPGEQPRGRVGGDTLSRLIREARLDDQIKALVLRVDSPGGSPIASELIRQELELAQISGKPVVASMAGVAASGGYWISATADEIWAAPTTVTGSIGVFAPLPTFEGLMEEIGINRDGVATHELAGMGVLNGIGPPLDRFLQITVDNTYRQFVNLVARGRDMLPEEVDAVGQGRVWSGADAKDRGLVDELGQLDDAIAAAARLAGLDEYEVRYIEKPRTAREVLLAQFAKNLGLVPNGMLGELSRVLDDLRWLTEPQHPVSLCQNCTVRY
jgi:protease-4